MLKALLHSSVVSSGLYKHESEWASDQALSAGVFIADLCSEGGCVDVSSESFKRKLRVVLLRQFQKPHLLRPLKHFEAMQDKTFTFYIIMVFTVLLTIRP